MDIYILRHAIAEDKKKWKKADSDRPLTKEGIRKMKKGARGIRRLGIKINWILTSPYLRAYATASIVAKELKQKRNLRVLKSLSPDGDPKALLRYLGLNVHSWEAVMLVGHEPYLSKLIKTLCGGISVELTKGGLARLAADALTDESPARLELLLPAKMLKHLS